MLDPKTENLVENGSNNQQAQTIHNSGIPPDLHERMFRDQGDRLQATFDLALAAFERAVEADKELLRKNLQTQAGQIAEFERRLANPNEALTNNKP